jgi:hypothetical protein
VRAQLSGPARRVGLFGAEQRDVVVLRPERESRRRIALLGHVAKERVEDG